VAENWRQKYSLGLRARFGVIHRWWSPKRWSMVLSWKAIQPMPPSTSTNSMPGWRSGTPP
jgi:hypothetical protein